MILLSTTGILLGSALAIAFAWFFGRPKNLPPGPSSLPLIGYRSGPGRVFEIYADLAKQFGPIFSLRRGPLLVVVLNNKDVIKQALVKGANVFSDRFVPKHIQKTFSDANSEASIVWTSGKPWVDLRKFGLTALRAFGMGKKSLEPHINLEARYLCDEIGKFRGRPASLHHILNTTTSNVICQLVFGRRFEYDDEEFKKTISALFENFVAISGSDLVNVFPFLINMPWYKKYRHNLQRLINFVKDQIKTHINSFERENIRDVIDSYLADESISSNFKVNEIHFFLLDFFAAGTETTSTTLSWAILYMSLYPDVQKKIQAELDAVVGRGRQPTMSDRPNLPYCDATLMEIMRIRPVAPISLPHKNAQTVSLGGYTIPKGTIIVPNLWAALHDPDDWEEPEEFRPGRFLDGDGKLAPKNDAWIPFSVGRRECLGAQLAKMEAFLFFTNLLQRFEFSLPQGQSRSRRGMDGLTMPPEPYQVCAKER